MGDESHLTCCLGAAMCVHNPFHPEYVGGFGPKRERCRRCGLALAPCVECGAPSQCGELLCVEHDDGPVPGGAS